MGSTTAMTSAQVGTVITSLTSDVATYFTDNIGIVIAFTVGFMVLGLLWRLTRRGFRV